MKRIALIVAAITVALSLAVPAGAYPGGDARFLDSLDRRGIYYPSANAIHDAHLVCQKLDAGWDYSSVIDEIMAYNPGFYGDRDLGIAFVVRAYMHYCPWHETP